MHKGLQSCLGMSFFHQFLDQLDAGEHHALASARNMWKQAMFDWVVLGAIGRVMGDADFNANLVGQGLQVLFEQVMSGIVLPPPSHLIKIEVAQEKRDFP